MGAFDELTALQSFGTPNNNPIGPGFGNYGSNDIFYQNGVVASGGTYTNQPSSGSGTATSGGGSNDGGGSNEPSGPTQAEIDAENARRAQKEADNRLRGDINTAHDNYISSLDAELGTLGTSNTAQQGTIDSTFNIGVGELDYQYGTGVQMLDDNRADATSNQDKNLRTLGSDTANAMQAGNVYLGAIGAGDSSAANQYSFALNKEATKQRSNVMQGTAKILGDINKRGVDLKNIYNREINSLTEKKNIAMNDLTQWFADAQRQIRDAKRQAGADRDFNLADLSRGLLDQATSRLNQIQAEESNRRNMLQQWALQQSTTLEQAKAKLQGESQFSFNAPTAGKMPGMNVGSSGQPTRQFVSNASSTDEDRNGLFYNQPSYSA